MSSEFPNLDALLSAAEVDALRRGKPIEKGKTRLQEKEDKRPLTRVDEKRFRKEVIDRDGKRCRCCKKKVEVTIEHVPQRREIHHIHGRRGSLRFEWRAALQLCLKCHQRCTGKVNDKLIILATKTFELFNEKTRVMETYTDATFPVVFKQPTEAEA